FIGQRVAFISSTDFSRDGLDALAPRAVAMAKLAPEDKFACLAPKDRLARALPELDLEDTAEPSADLLIARARDAEAAALAVEGAPSSEGGNASFNRSAVALATSEGFLGRYAGTSHAVGVAVLAGEGVDMQMDYDNATARHADNLGRAETIGRLAGER